MRPVMAHLACLTLLLLGALALSGCIGNSATVAGQGYAAGTKTKTLNCGTSATLASGHQGTGKMTVVVTDGANNAVYTNGDYGAGQSGDAQALTGQPGTWTLQVSTGFGYVGQWAVTLSC